MGLTNFTSSSTSKKGGKKRAPTPSQAALSNPATAPAAIAALFPGAKIIGVQPGKSVGIGVTSKGKIVDL